jgi:hyperosmotically inducible protein
MRLTRKGKLLLGTIIILGAAGGGSAYYLKLQKLTLKQAWEKLISRTQTSEPSRNNDAEIKAAILQAVLKDPGLRNQSVEVTVAQGAVTATGLVETSLQRAALEEIVKDVPGVKTVTLNVVAKAPGTATPKPPVTKEDLDERLAKEVEFTLYKTDAFEVKTLKIICRDGVVRLSGTVRNLAERLLAEKIAQEIEGVRQVVNDLEIGK